MFVYSLSYRILKNSQLQHVYSWLSRLTHLHRACVLQKVKGSSRNSTRDFLSVPFLTYCIWTLSCRFCWFSTQVNGPWKRTNRRDKKLTLKKLMTNCLFRSLRYVVGHFAVPHLMAVICVPVHTFNFQ